MKMLSTIAAVTVLSVGLWMRVLGETSEVTLPGFRTSPLTPSPTSLLSLGASYDIRYSTSSTIGSDDVLKSPCQASFGCPNEELTIGDVGVGNTPALSQVSSLSAPVTQPPTTLPKLSRTVLSVAGWISRGNLSKGSNRNALDSSRMKLSNPTGSEMSNTPPLTPTDPSMLLTWSWIDDLDATDDPLERENEPQEAQETSTIGIFNNRSKKLSRFENLKTSEDAEQDHQQIKIRGDINPNRQSISKGNDFFLRVYESGHVDNIPSGGENKRHEDHSPDENVGMVMPDSREILRIKLHSKDSQEGSGHTAPMTPTLLTQNEHDFSPQESPRDWTFNTAKEEEELSIFKSFSRPTSVVAVSERPSRLSDVAAKDKRPHNFLLVSKQNVHTTTQQPISVQYDPIDSAIIEKAMLTLTEASTGASHYSTPPAKVNQETHAFPNNTRETTFVETSESSAYTTRSGNAQYFQQDFKTSGYPAIPPYETSKLVTSVKVGAGSSTPVGSTSGQPQVVPEFIETEVSSEKSFLHTWTDHSPGIYFFVPPSEQKNEDFPESVVPGGTLEHSWITTPVWDELAELSTRETMTRLHSSSEQTSRAEFNRTTTHFSSPSRTYSPTGHEQIFRLLEQLAEHHNIPSENLKNKKISSVQLETTSETPESSVWPEQPPILSEIALDSIEQKHEQPIVWPEQTTQWPKQLIVWTEQSDTQSEQAKWTEWSLPDNKPLNKVSERPWISNEHLTEKPQHTKPTTVQTHFVHDKTTMGSGQTFSDRDTLNLTPVTDALLFQPPPLSNGYFKKPTTQPNEHHKYKDTHEPHEPLKPQEQFLRPQEQLQRHHEQLQRHHEQLQRPHEQLQRPHEQSPRPQDQLEKSHELLIKTSDQTHTLKAATDNFKTKVKLEQASIEHEQHTMHDEHRNVTPEQPTTLAEVYKINQGNKWLQQPDTRLGQAHANPEQLYKYQQLAFGTEQPNTDPEQPNRDHELPNTDPDQPDTDPQQFWPATEESRYRLEQSSRKPALSYVITQESVANSEQEQTMYEKHSSAIKEPHIDSEQINNRPEQLFLKPQRQYSGLEPIYEPQTPFLTQSKDVGIKYVRTDISHGQSKINTEQEAGLVDSVPQPEQPTIRTVQSEIAPEKSELRFEQVIKHHEQADSFEQLRHPQIHPDQHQISLEQTFTSSEGTEMSSKISDFTTEAPSESLPALRQLIKQHIQTLQTFMQGSPVKPHSNVHISDGSEYIPSQVPERTEYIRVQVPGTTEFTPALFTPANVPGIAWTLLPPAVLDDVQNGYAQTTNYTHVRYDQVTIPGYTPSVVHTPVIHDEPAGFEISLPTQPAPASTTSDLSVEDLDDIFSFMGTPLGRLINKTQEGQGGTEAATHRSQYISTQDSSLPTRQDVEGALGATKYPRVVDTAFHGQKPLEHSEDDATPPTPGKYTTISSSLATLEKDTTSVLPGIDSVTPKCENESVLSPFLKFYGSLYPGLINPCKERFTHEPVTSSGSQEPATKLLLLTNTSRESLADFTHATQEVRNSFKSSFSDDDHTPPYYTQPTLSFNEQSEDRIFITAPSSVVFHDPTEDINNFISTTVVSPVPGMNSATAVASDVSFPKDVNVDNFSVFSTTPQHQSVVTLVGNTAGLGSQVADGSPPTQMPTKPTWWVRVPTIGLPEETSLISLKSETEQVSNEGPTRPLTKNPAVSNSDIASLLDSWHRRWESWSKSRPKFTASTTAAHFTLTTSTSQTSESAQQSANSSLPSQEDAAGLVVSEPSSQEKGSRGLPSAATTLISELSTGASVLLAAVSTGASVSSTAASMTSQQSSFEPESEIILPTTQSIGPPAQTTAATASQVTMQTTQTMIPREQATASTPSSSTTSISPTTAQVTIPTTQASTPTTQASTPTTQATTPATQATTPTTQVTTPTTQVTSPATQATTPTTQVTTPTTQVTTPSQVTTPTTQATIPTTQVTTPTIQATTPTTQVTTPALNTSQSSGLSQILGSIWNMVGFGKTTTTLAHTTRPEDFSTASTTTSSTVTSITATAATAKNTSESTTSTTLRTISSPTTTSYSTTELTTITAIIFNTSTHTTTITTSPAKPSITTTTSPSPANHTTNQSPNTTTTTKESILRTFWEYSLSKTSTNTESKKNIYNEEKPTSSIPLYTVHNLTTAAPASVVTVGTSFTTDDSRLFDYIGDTSSSNSENALKLMENKTETEASTPSSIESLGNLFRLIGNLRGSKDELQNSDKRILEGIRNSSPKRPSVPHTLSTSLAGMFPLLPTIFDEESQEKHISHRNFTKEPEERTKLLTLKEPDRHTVTGLPPDVREGLTTKVLTNNPHPTLHLKLPPYNHHSSISDHQHYPLHRPTIIIKKEGTRMTIPIMPSADFSSFTPHGFPDSTTLSDWHPKDELSPSSKISRHGLAALVTASPEEDEWRSVSDSPQHEVKIPRPVKTPSLLPHLLRSPHIPNPHPVRFPPPRSPSSPRPPPRPRHPLHLPPSPRLPPPSRLPPPPRLPSPPRLPPPPRLPLPPPPTIPASLSPSSVPRPPLHFPSPGQDVQREQSCGVALLHRLDHLLGREMVMDQFGVRVYTSVIDSILTVECQHPEWREPSPSPSPQALTSMPTHTMGMEGWLTLDDIRAQRAEALQLQQVPGDSARSFAEDTGTGGSDLLRNHLPASPMTVLSPALPLDSITASLVATPAPSAESAHQLVSSPLPNSLQNFSSFSVTTSSIPSSSSVSSLISLYTNSSSSILSSSSNSSFPSFSSSTTSYLLTSFPTSTPPLSSLSEPAVTSSSFSESFSLLLTSPSSVKSTYALPPIAGVETDRVRREAVEGGRKRRETVEEARKRKGEVQIAASLLTTGEQQLLVLHSLRAATATAMSTDSTLGDKALSLSTTKIFRFKTILIGLIYFSFGVFLYQTIRCAVEKRVPSALITTSRNTGRHVDGVDYQAASLLHTLDKMPEVAVEAVLLSEKGSEVWVRQPPCLPVYLGHLNLFHQQQPQENSSNLHHSAVSSAM